MLFRSFGLILVLLACRPGSNPAPDLTLPSVVVPPDPTGSTKTYTYLALGDSYTIGTSVEESARWGLQLADLLRKKGVLVQNPDILAQAGWTTTNLLNALAANPTKARYDLVSLLIGVNNQYQGKSLEAYQSELGTLLKTAIDKAGGAPQRVFMLSTPDWGVTPFAAGEDRARITREIDQFNARASALCAQLGVAFIDITPISRTAYGDASLMASDQLHFSGKMYGLWAEKAAGPVEKLLR